MPCERDLGLAKLASMEEESGNQTPASREASMDSHVAFISTSSAAGSFADLPSSRWSLVPPLKGPANTPTNISATQPTKYNSAEHSQGTYQSLPTTQQSKGLKRPADGTAFKTTQRPRYTIPNFEEPSLLIESKRERLRLVKRLLQVCNAHVELEMAKAIKVLIGVQSDRINKLQEEVKSLKAQLAAAQGQGPSNVSEEHQTWAEL